MPVFRVTVMEAYLFAEWLGGKLPTRDEWMKATGVEDLSTPTAEEDTAGPFVGSASARKALGLQGGDYNLTPHGFQRIACRSIQST